MTKALQAAKDKAQNDLGVLKNDLIAQYKKQLDDLMAEKQQLEAKVDQLKNQLADERSSNKLGMHDLESAAQTARDKVQDYERRCLDLETKLQWQITTGNDGYKQDLDKLNQERYELQLMVQQLQDLVMQLENDKLALQKTLETERSLSQDKVKYLTEQIEESRHERNEQLENFLKSNRDVKKVHAAQIDQLQQEHQAALFKIQMEHQTQLQNVQDQFSLQLTEAEEKSREMSKQLARYIDEFSHQTRSTQSESEIIEQHIIEYQKRESDLRNEILSYKSNEDILKQQNMNQLEMLRKESQMALNILEERCEQLKHDRQKLIFEHENERAAWNLEREHLNREKQNLQDQLNAFGRKHEALLTENQRNISRQFQSQYRSLNKRNNLTTQSVLASNSKGKYFTGANRSFISPSSPRPSVDFNPASSGIFIDQKMIESDDDTNFNKENKISNMHDDFLESMTKRSTPITQTIQLKTITTEIPNN